MSNIEKIESILSKKQLPISLYELHGLLAGYLAGGGDQSMAIWSKPLLDKKFKNHNLQDFASQIAIDLASPTFSFELLLPEDHCPLTEQAAALVAWVQAFLSGLGQSNCSAQLLSSDEMKESLQDLNSIAELNVHDMQGAGEEEAQLTEISEYVRTVAMFIYTELHGPRDSSVH